MITLVLNYCLKLWAFIITKKTDRKCIFLVSHIDWIYIFVDIGLVLVVIHIATSTGNIRVCWIRNLCLVYFIQSLDKYGTCYYM